LDLHRSFPTSQIATVFSGELMEQRRLRLGDIVDDYCPRERRVTNHAIVAMVEEDVKQTRCTTCDAEHAYKGGAAPRRRKKDSTGALYKEVLAGITDGDTTPVLTTPVPAPPVVRTAVVHEDVQETVQASSNGGAPHSDSGQHSDVAEQVDQVQGLAQPEDEVQDMPQAVEDGPVHRPLIRATLPRLEGHKETRQATDFTIRQSNGRGANFQSNRGGDQRGRPRNGSGHGQGQGQPSNRPPGGGSRFAGARSNNQGRGAAGRPPGGGFRAGQGQRRGPGGGRKRSR
jgi:hypothetical protein